MFSAEVCTEFNASCDRAWNLSFLESSRQVEKSWTSTKRVAHNECCRMRWESMTKIQLLSPRQHSLMVASCRASATLTVTCASVFSVWSRFCNTAWSGCSVENLVGINSVAHSHLESCGFDVSVGISLFGIPHPCCATRCQSCSREEFDSNEFSTTLPLSSSWSVSPVTLASRIQ